MLPGPMAFWIVGGLSAVALAVMGVFSYNSYKKEQAKLRLSRRRQLREQMEAQVPDEPIFDEPIAQAPTPIVPPTPVSERTPTTTRNDFDFKF